MGESTVNNFTRAEVLEALASGAVLHCNDGMDGPLAVLVWPDGKAKAADKYVCNACDDADFLSVVRSEKEGLELTISDEGREWLDRWQRITPPAPPTVQSSDNTEEAQP